MSVHPYPTSRGTRYQVRWRSFRAGVETQHKQGGFPNKKLALEYERKLSPDTDYRASQTPFESYCDRYLSRQAELKSWKPRTVEGHTSALKYARAYFGPTPIGRIRPAACLDYWAWLKE
jgi:hypothetical protein